MDEDFNLECSADNHIRDFNQQISQFNSDNMSDPNLKNILNTLSAILIQQQNMILEKPDRFELIEFQNVMANKANSRDFQILVNEVLRF